MGFSRVSFQVIQIVYIHASGSVRKRSVSEHSSRAPYDQHENLLNLPGHQCLQKQVSSRTSLNFPAQMILRWLSLRVAVNAPEDTAVWFFHLNKLLTIEVCAGFLSVTLTPTFSFSFLRSSHYLFHWLMKLHCCQHLWSHPPQDLSQLNDAGCHVHFRAAVLLKWDRYDPPKDQSRVKDDV